MRAAPRRRGRYACVDGGGGGGGVASVVGASPPASPPSFPPPPPPPPIFLHYRLPSPPVPAITYLCELKDT